MAVDKHINFFELQKAAEKPGCPLCRIINDRAEMYIDNLLFEHVSDRTFRALHRAAGGFCSYHSRNLVSFRDGLAVAILSRDLLDDRIISFEERKPWRPRGRCPICVERDRIEEEYLGFLAESHGDTKEEQELRQIFTASDGLCAPHYSALLFPRAGRGRWRERNRDGRRRGGERRGGMRIMGRSRTLPQWLTDFHDSKFRDLYGRVMQFIDFSAYGRKEDFDSLSEQDQLVWKEAAAALRGAVD